MTGQESGARGILGSWRKLGQIFAPTSGFHPLLMSHAANPLPLWLHQDVYRVYYSGRDAQRRSSVGSVDIDLATLQIVGESSTPWVKFGPPNSFYSHGISIGNTYRVGSDQYMLFMGWHIPEGGHWYGQIGRLKVLPDGTLTPDSEHPFMPLDAEDPISLSYPWVLVDRAGFHMWYGSTVSWDAGNGEMEHVIKYAHSTDGTTWTKKGIAIPSIVGEAQAFSRPTVLATQSGYHAWFSYRSGLPGQKYRIGYAQGTDPSGLKLQLDSVRLDVSTQGWDCDMIEYPYVWVHRGTTYMLYNGNDYGRSGFGLAVMDGL